MGWPTRDVTVRNNCSTMHFFMRLFVKKKKKKFQTSTKPSDSTASPCQLEKFDNSAAPKRKPNPPPPKKTSANLHACVHWLSPAR